MIFETNSITMSLLPPPVDLKEIGNNAIESCTIVVQPLSWLHFNIIVTTILCLTVIVIIVLFMLNTRISEEKKTVNKYKQENTELWMTVTNGSDTVNLVPCIFLTKLIDIEYSPRLGNVKLITERFGFLYYLNIDWACINLQSITYKFKLQLPSQIPISWSKYRTLNRLIKSNFMIRIMYAEKEDNILTTLSASFIANLLFRYNKRQSQIFN